MSRGHVVGTKREKKHSQDWYREIQAEHLARIEKEWQEREAAKLTVGQK